MTDTIRVQSANPDSRRIALYERDDEHPTGEVLVVGDRIVEVARTPEVERKLGKRVLVEVAGDTSSATEPPQDAPEGTVEPPEGDASATTPDDAETWPEGVTDVQIAALVEAGYATPEQVAAASDDDLMAVVGVGAATVARLRG